MNCRLKYNTIQYNTIDERDSILVQSSSIFQEKVFPATMTSHQRDGVTLTNILKQVDSLEREIRDLGREAQKGEQFIKNLEEVIDR